MKIQSLHFVNAGPLGTRDIDFFDNWNGSVETNLLLTGPNGCGKTTLLRVVALLWEAAGYWLDNNQALPLDHPVCHGLARWGAVGLILDEVNIGQANPIRIGLFCSRHGVEVGWMKNRPDVHWLGQHLHPGNTATGPIDAFVSTKGDWLDNWASARQKMLLGFSTPGLSNLIFMDAEERRWVAPTRRVGEVVAELPALRWAPRYCATEDWRGQLEASLINMKLTDEPRFVEVLADLNRFLVGKQIQGDIRRGENRLLVRLDDPNAAPHTLDDLSTGERQVLILLYTIARWAEPGAVVMIDEPELFLHPSLVNGMLARLKALVQARNGQLLITSHLPLVWQRYEGMARRIELGALGE